MGRGKRSTRKVGRERNVSRIQCHPVKSSRSQHTPQSTLELITTPMHAHYQDPISSPFFKGKAVCGLSLGRVRKMPTFQDALRIKCKLLTSKANKALALTSPCILSSLS